MKERRTNSKLMDRSGEDNAKKYKTCCTRTARETADNRGLAWPDVHWLSWGKPQTPNPGRRYTLKRVQHDRLPSGNISNWVKRGLRAVRVFRKPITTNGRGRSRVSGDERQKLLRIRWVGTSRENAQKPWRDLKGESWIKAISTGF